MKLITMKRGGAGGHVAINLDLVTQVRSSAGPFTDIHFMGQEFVTVEGQFAQVVARLTAAAKEDNGAVTTWTPMRDMSARRA